MSNEGYPMIMQFVDTINDYMGFTQKKKFTYECTYCLYILFRIVLSVVLLVLLLGFFVYVDIITFNPNFLKELGKTQYLVEMPPYLFFKIIIGIINFGFIMFTLPESIGNFVFKIIGLPIYLPYKLGKRLLQKFGTRINHDK